MSVCFADDDHTPSQATELKEALAELMAQLTAERASAEARAVEVKELQIEQTRVGLVVCVFLSSFLDRIFRYSLPLKLGFCPACFGTQPHTRLYTRAQSMTELTEELLNAKLDGSAQQHQQVLQQSAQVCVVLFFHLISSDLYWPVSLPRSPLKFECFCSRGGFAPQEQMRAVTELLAERLGDAAKQQQEQQQQQREQQQSSAEELMQRQQAQMEALLESIMQQTQQNSAAVVESIKEKMNTHAQQQEEAVVESMNARAQEQQKAVIETIKVVSQQQQEQQQQAVVESIEGTLKAVAQQQQQAVVESVKAVAQEQQEKSNEQAQRAAELLAERLAEVQKSGADTLLQQQQQQQDALVERVQEALVERVRQVGLLASLLLR